jgi:histidinol dehydrogenase
MSAVRVQRLAELSPRTLAGMAHRGSADLEAVRPAVEAIVRDVRTRGDTALREHTRKFDGADLQDFAVETGAPAAAFHRLDPRLRGALELMADHLERVARAQLPAAQRIEVRPGLEVRRRFTPIDRVGLYIPGGSAAYPSTLLMAAVPARIAGCREIVICSPPRADGSIAPALLAAAHRAGVGTLFRLGGAQAVAAMAFGTQTVPSVDKIVGPGNRFVTAAKLAVFPQVEIDLPAGPSECLIIADDTARPEAIAAELLAQAEHGVDSTAILLTPSAELARRVQRAVEQRVGRLERAAAIGQALAERGGILLTDSLEEAVHFANSFASEHVQVTAADAAALAGQIRHAGSIFVGAHAPVPAGDYACGSNHILPTGGRARAASGLSVETYGKWTQFQSLTAPALRAIAPAIAVVAAAEGMTAHAVAVQARLHGAARTAPPPIPPMRAALARFRPYEWEPSTAALAARYGIRPAAVLRFDMNTLPAVPPRWAATLRRIAGEAFQEYDDASYTRLVTQLVRYTGVGPDQLTVGAGADELLDLCAKVFIDRGTRAVVPQPTYSMFAVVTTILDGQPVGVPRRPDFSLDVQAVVEAARSAGAVFLCNPNNPTGTLTPLKDIAAIARQVSCAVLVDEAYYEFGQVSASALIARHPNVVVIRTFSKAFALASARVGYSIAHPAVAKHLNQVRPPTSVSRASVRLAEAALSDLAGMRRRVQSIERERARLAADLRKLRLAVAPSHANFLLVQVPQAGRVAQALQREGLVLRTFVDEPLAQHLRITVRTRADNARLVEALRRG